MQWEHVGAWSQLLNSTSQVLHLCKVRVRQSMVSNPGTLLWGEGILIVRLNIYSVLNFSDHFLRLLLLPTWSDESPLCHLLLA